MTVNRTTTISVSALVVALKATIPSFGQIAVYRPRRALVPVLYQDQPCAVCSVQCYDQLMANLSGQFTKSDLPDATYCKHECYMYTSIYLMFSTVSPSSLHTQLTSRANIYDWAATTD